MSGYPVIIAGAGPAGIACAVQLRRRGIDFLLVDPGPAGGLLRNANLVENYPGFPEGIGGPKLARLLERHLEHQSIQVARETVRAVDWQEEFSVQTDQHHYAAGRLVLATGTRPVEIPLKLTPELSKKVYYEVADLPAVNGTAVCIVGGGDAAYDYALSLAGRGCQVTVNIRGGGPRCLPLLAERAGRQSNINIRPGHSLRRIRMKGSRLLLEWQIPEGAFEEQADALLVAIGREPNLGYLSPEVQVRRPELESSGRLFPVGDLVAGRFRQAAIAAGDGLRAAMVIADKLRIEPRPKDAGSNPKSP